MTRNQLVDFWFNTNIFSNYHKHDSYSNVSTADSAIHPIDYIARAFEFGHRIVTSTNHGVSYNWKEYHMLCDSTPKIVETMKALTEEQLRSVEFMKKLKKKIHPKVVDAISKRLLNGQEIYPLQFVYGVEPYFVADRHEKDNRNYHMIILAKNQEGIYELNSAISEANVTGFYYKPRLDWELLETLTPENVMVTTSCLGGILRDDDHRENLERLHKMFGKNLYIEVQPHHTDKQMKLNKRAVALSEEYGIPLIAGIDSHMINNEDDPYHRDEFLKSKGIRYEDEEGWFMDYCSGQELFERFACQGVLEEEHIVSAISNTNICMTFDHIPLDTSIKLPTMYPGKTQEQVDFIFRQLITNRWLDYEETVLKKRDYDRDLYLQEVKKEVDIVIKTGMADYFLLNYWVVKLGREKYGGVLTYTGRGSGASFLLNMLLGFTAIDRLAVNVPLIPERFMSIERILETRSLPDIDHNTADPMPFQLAQQELLGEHGSYWMCAWGRLKEKSAFKMYAKANSIDPKLANEITKQLDEYENDKKYEAEHLLEDDESHVYLEDYVDAKYIPILEESKIYIGIADSVSRSPCSFLLLNGDIRREIGVFRVKSGDIVANIDGGTSDTLKYLKNDILTVSTVDITDKVFKKLGIAQPIPTDLIDMCDGDENVWGIFANGSTVEVNQVAQPGTRAKAQKYKPINIDEHTMFVAAVRPSFKSMVDIFLNRKDFTYQIGTFDNLLQGKHSKDSFLLFQEQIMIALEFAGIPMGETMTLIKAISKKKHDTIMKYHDTFLDGFADKIKTEYKDVSDDLAKKTSKAVWKIIEDSAEYGFNCSHALAVALDSLYNAYCKAHHTYEFYLVTLERYTEKGDKEKVAHLRREMTQFFGIKTGKYQFGLDNRGFVADKENGYINPSLKSIKYINQNVSEVLYELGSNDETYESFVELCRIMKERGLTKTHIETLAKIGYFPKHGTTPQLLEIYDMMYEQLKGVQYKKAKMDENAYSDLILEYHDKETAKLYKFEKETLPTLWGHAEHFIKGTLVEDLTFRERIQYELFYLNEIITPIPSDCIGVMEIEVSSAKSRWIKARSYRDGKEHWFKSKKGKAMPEKEEIIIITEVGTTFHNKREVYTIDGYELIQ